ncbi:MAG: ABC transporter ATP-binding protein [Rhodospirillales bacterium]|nr:ABC transporter ATP-binding protein [Rhodospirillales bacterium]
MSALLEVRDVRVHFGGVRAVDGVSFDVQEGTIAGLIGPNGSGKTSTFNLITGFYTASAGTITFAGDAILGRAPHEIARRGIVRTFQNVALQPDRTLLENVMLGLYCNRSGLWRGLFDPRPARQDEQRALEILEFCGLYELRDALSRNVPIGLRHTAELARALAARPKLLLLDEPWAGLNNAESAALIRTVRRIRDSKITVLVVEHNMKVIMEICDRITVLDAGRKIAEGSPAEVRANPAVIASYLGTAGH